MYDSPKKKCSVLDPLPMENMSDKCHVEDEKIFCLWDSKIVQFSTQTWLLRPAKSRKILYFQIRFVGRRECFLDSDLN